MLRSRVATGTVVTTTGMLSGFTLAVAGLFTGQYGLLWGGLVAVFAVAEANGIVSETEGDTLSEQTRTFWRTKTVAGRWAFVTVWSVFAVSFAGHIAGVVWS